MTSPNLHPLIRKITEDTEGLTPKGKILRDFIVAQPRKAVFMTIKELAEACGVSEATVVRFVTHLGYRKYSDFQQALRDYVDMELTLVDRLEGWPSSAPTSSACR